MPICLYSCRPKRRLGAAIAVCAFFFVAAMAFSAVGLNNQLRRIFNLTAVFLLTVCFLTAKRFLATAYSYTVCLGESDDLVIYEHTLADKEPLAVCRVAISDISEIRVSRKKKKSGKEKRADKNRARRFLSYTVSVFESEYITLVFTDGDESSELRLSYDEGLLQALNRVSVLK